MPTKKTGKTSSQASKKTNASKKPTSKKNSSATKAPAKKIASKKSEQVIKNETSLTKKVKPKKMLWPILILLVVLGLWFLRDQVIVAMVNGKPITRFQVIKELEKQGASQVLSSLVTMELVDQAIKESGIEIDEQEVADQIAELEKEFGSQGQDFDDLLAMQNLTRADVEKDIKLNLQADKILEDKIQVTEEEVMKYFETNKEFLGEPLGIKSHELLHTHYKRRDVVK